VVVRLVGANMTVDAGLCRAQLSAALVRLGSVVKPLASHLALWA
jgi:hypothetical protein